MFSIAAATTAHPAALHHFIFFHLLLCIIYSCCAAFLHGLHPWLLIVKSLRDSFYKTPSFTIFYSISKPISTSPSVFIKEPKVSFLRFYLPNQSPRPPSLPLSLRDGEGTRVEVSPNQSPQFPPPSGEIEGAKTIPPAPLPPVNFQTQTLLLFHISFLQPAFLRAA
jgi:hypothetical protein